MPGMFNFFSSAGREGRRERQRDELRTKMLRQARNDKLEASHQRNVRSRHEREPPAWERHYGLDNHQSGLIGRSRTLPSRTTRSTNTSRRDNYGRQPAIANRFDDDQESIAGWPHEDPDELRYGNVPSRVMMSSGRHVRRVPSERAMPDIAVYGGIYWPEHSRSTRTDNRYQPAREERYYYEYDQAPRSRRHW